MSNHTLKYQMPFSTTELLYALVDVAEADKVPSVFCDIIESHNYNTCDFEIRSFSEGSRTERHPQQKKENGEAPSNRDIPIFVRDARRIVKSLPMQAIDALEQLELIKIDQVTGKTMFGQDYPNRYLIFLMPAAYFRASYERSNCIYRWWLRSLEESPTLIAWLGLVLSLIALLQNILGSENASSAP